MKAVHGEYNLCRSSIVEWHKIFLEGNELLEEDAQPRQVHRVITPEMISEVNALVLDNHRITLDEIHRLLRISMGTVYTIMHQHLKFRKIYTQWIPHLLTS
ncbi:histone-lysine N-methyltransferase SETMAR [Trichonephila clavata]|uniref:Histone-lysine N-methyltransferase SETMAR n=1 Tax=Trichonephila clavata TaxID=2740835 RepID=A0A8X6J1T9_TRICU|nr:histone-lysine N-methyltransferase SETMAR [Trichonephila clavata]